MLKLNEERVGNWYDGVDFENSHLVTNKNFNSDLGISGIILRKPNSYGAKGNVFASVSVRFTNGLEVMGSIYVSTDGDSIYFNTDQREYKDAKTGERKFADINVTVPMSIQAQVLRFATTKAVVVAGVPSQFAGVSTRQSKAVQQQANPAPVANHAPQATQQPQYQAPAAPVAPPAQPAYQAPAEQAAPAQTFDATNYAAIMGQGNKTAEELHAFINNM